MLLTRFEGCELPGFGADIFGERPDQPVIRVLFHDVGCPTHDARHRKDGGKEGGLDAQRVEHGGRIEIDVGIQSPFPKGNFSYLFGNLIEFHIS